MQWHGKNKNKISIRQMYQRFSRIFYDETTVEKTVKMDNSVLITDIMR